MSRSGVTHDIRVAVGSLVPCRVLLGLCLCELIAIGRFQEGIDRT